MPAWMQGDRTVDTLEALRTRRSIRLYQERAVARELIESVIDCARMAATARNEQPWEFVAVTDPETRQQIAEMAEHGRFIADAPVCVAVFCQDTKYYIEDGSAATQNLLVAAWAVGLGTCWVAGDKKEYADAVRELLGAPTWMRLVSLVSVGYAASKPEPPKRSLSEVLHWERY